MKLLSISLLCLNLFYVSSGYAECGDIVSPPDADIRTCDKTCSTSAGPRSYYATRSVGSNTARQLLGWQDRINRFKICEKAVWGATALAFEYQRTFRPRQIAQQLLGSNRLSFKGSQVVNRNNNCDIVADYFGLPTTYEGELSVCPEIKNWITEFQVYFGLDKWFPGLYLRLNAPIAHTKWNLHAKTHDNTTSTQEALFPVGYMGINSQNPLTGPVAAVSKLSDALCGCPGFGDKKAPWHFAKFSFDSLELTRLSNLDVIFGWNFAEAEDYHFGLSAYLVIPAGNKPDPEFIFSPVIGNDRHWELGLGFSGHQDLWASTHPGHKLGVYVEGCITHLFKNIQRRTFDFCGNGPLSRYLLLKQIGKPALVADGITIVPQDPNAYANNLISGNNWATRFTGVSVPLKVDASIKFSYTNCSFDFDLGYNFYSQTREKVSILRDYPTVYDSNRFGIKGREGTNYFVRSADANSTTQVATLNSTSSKSTIYNGSLQDQLTTDNAVLISGPGSFGYIPAGEPSVLTADQYGANWHNPNTNFPQTVAEAQINNSAAYYSGNGPIPAQPAIIIPENLNPYSAAARGFMTHKLFGFASYNLIGKWEPFMGIGGEIEFENRHKKRGHEQWGIYLKAGMTF